MIGRLDSQFDLIDYSSSFCFQDETTPRDREVRDVSNHRSAGYQSGESFFVAIHFWTYGQVSCKPQPLKAVFLY